MAVNPIIECFGRDLVPEYCQGLESSAVYTMSPGFVESYHGRSIRSLFRLPLHMHADEMIPTFLMSNMYIGLCHPKALTLTRLQLYEMFEVMLSLRINISVGLRGILNFRRLRDVFLYRLAGGIPLQQGFPYPLQSKVRTPPPHLR